MLCAALSITSNVTFTSSELGRLYGPPALHRLDSAPSIQSANERWQALPVQAGCDAADRARGKREGEGLDEAL